MPTREDLQILQAQDLELKVALTKQRIREWVTEFSSQGVYVSFSGGYDENGIWKPNDKGLGMGHVFDELNKLYGENFIKYK